MSRGAHAGRLQSRMWAIALSAVIVAIVAAIALAGSAPRRGPRVQGGSETSGPDPSSSAAPSSPSPGPDGGPLRFRVGVSWFRFVDDSRSLPGAEPDVPRTLRTVVWYPVEPTTGQQATSASAEVGAPFPLVVFGHGFNLSPGAYGPLLRAWTRAGYVVAAPLFPLTSPGATGGLNESDIVNQPADVSFVVSRLLALSGESSGRLSGLIDASRIAVAGHSDGGETAMAVAYGSCCRDDRIGAAIIMAGDEMNIAGATYFTEPGPPLLAIQGTGDAVNPPALTMQLYREAPAPKYALWLRGGDHLAPYIGRDRLEAVVRLVTLQFLDRYLRPDPAASIELPARIRASGLAVLRRRV